MSEAARHYVVWVEFALQPQHQAEFMHHLTLNANESLAGEPGCLRFDVLLPEEDDTAAVALYEIYESRAAFEAHLASAHYRAFDSVTRPMIVGKVARFFLLSDPVPATGDS